MVCCAVLWCLAVSLLLCHVVFHCAVLCCCALCCVVLCCVVLCCVVLCCVVLCCVVLCCVVLCCVVLCCFALCCGVALCCVVVCCDIALCCVVFCCVVLCCGVVCCVVLCCVVLCYVPFQSPKWGSTADTRPWTSYTHVATSLYSEWLRPSYALIKEGLNAELVSSKVRSPVGKYPRGGGGDSVSRTICIYNFWRNKSRAIS